MNSNKERAVVENERDMVAAYSLGCLLLRNGAVSLAAWSRSYIHLLAVQRSRLTI